MPHLFQTFVLSALAPVVLVPTLTAGPPTGLQAEVKVKKPTRLDWEFVASGFGKKALKLRADFDSLQQRFQLYVPGTYDPTRSWPLVVFVSPGDAPLGWRYWQKVCEERGLLFCAPYAAGNNCPAGQRIRIILDMLDQVRRDYRIDPERTYLSGFSGGGRVACTVAFALPEYFGGVIPFCGTNPLNSLDYLRHRVQDRLSVALVTGETDFNRPENEKFMAPLLRDLDIRCKLWVVPKLGHGVPGPATLGKVFQWLEEDLKRRREDVKQQPALACPPDDALTPVRLGNRLLEAAEAEIKTGRVWHGVTLLQGVIARYGRVKPGGEARKRLDAIKEDARLLRLVDEQGGQEERTMLAAQARALAAFGQVRGARQAWKALAEGHPSSPEGKKAAEELQKLNKALASTPYLGIRFAGQAVVVAEAETGGPANRAGVQPGDRIRSLAGVPVTSLTDLRRSLSRVKPGDRVKLEAERKGKTITLTVEVGSLAGDGK
jgi:PDZ domain